LRRKRRSCAVISHYRGTHSDRRKEVLHIKQRVICVNDRRWPGGYTYVPKLPKMGSVYTIRTIVPCKVYGYDEDGLFLVELVNPVRVHNSPRGPMKGELKFRVSRFRPVHTTNIDVFLAMLEPMPARKPAELVPV
jgi:hypothetical protein